VWHVLHHLCLCVVCVLCRLLSGCGVWFVVDHMLYIYVYVFHIFTILFTKLFQNSRRKEFFILKE